MRNINNSYKHRLDTDMDIGRRSTGADGKKSDICNISLKYEINTSNYTSVNICKKYRGQTVGTGDDISTYIYFGEYAGHVD